MQIGVSLSSPHGLKQQCQKTPIPVESGIGVFVWNWPSVLERFCSMVTVFATWFDVIIKAMLSSGCAVYRINRSVSRLAHGRRRARRTDRQWQYG